MRVKLFKIFLTSWPFWLGLFSGIIFFSLNITGKNFQYFPGDLGDARFNNYILEHAHKFITGQTKSLWDAPFMYPESNVITYSDNLIGTAPFYSIFRILGYDRETSFQWWLLLITGLNFACCFFFLKSLSGNKYGAVLGAFVFAFSLSLQSQMTHAQTFTRFLIPLSFWMIFLFSKELKPRYYFAALFILVYQLYCGIYLGLLLLIPLMFLIRFSLLCNIKVFEQKMKDNKWLIKIVGATVINFIISLPLIIPYAKRALNSASIQYKDIYHTIPTIKSYFFSQRGSFFWDFLSNNAIEYPAWWDHQIFVGGIAMICMVIFIILVILKITKRRSIIQFSSDNFLVVLVLTCIVTFFYFTRCGTFSFYWIVSKIPGFGALRSLTRIMNIELIFFSVAVGFVFGKLLNIHKWYTIFIFMVILALLIADNYLKEGFSYRTEKGLAQARTEVLIKKTKDIPAGSVVSYEPLKLEAYPFIYHLDAMLVTQKLNLKTVNGYSATSPGGYSRFWNELSSEARMEWFKTKNYSPDTIYIIH